jgi:ubiquinol-cytochrome c reductase iron-sulfur subunit
VNLVIQGRVQLLSNTSEIVYSILLYSCYRRGKPVFLVHRDAKQIKQAKEEDVLAKEGLLRDPQLDSERVQREEWLICEGICTHLGCVPIWGMGDYHGFFCPCHGSHYDTSARIRKGPAPLNLRIPHYKFVGDNKVVLG